MILQGEELLALVVQAKRIADTLDDYLTLTLTTSELQVLQQDPEVNAAIRPLLDAIDRIKARRDRERTG